MTPIITYKYNTVAEIRLKKLGKLRAGPHLLGSQGRHPSGGDK